MLLTIILLCSTLLVECNEDAARQFAEFHNVFYQHQYQSMLKKAEKHKRDVMPPSAIIRELKAYTDGNETMTGYAAYCPGVGPSKKPTVLVVHDWNGRDKFENGKADALARLGYYGFAVDLYGKRGSSVEENRALMKPFRENRTFLLHRLQLALDEVRKARAVDQSKIGAIGFCFGGMSVLDMARAGWDLKGVVSFHGSLNAPPQQQNTTIKAKILVLHGHDDRAISPATVQTFEEEMTSRKADWQVHVYGNTVHSFTEPMANSTNSMYNPVSDKRSWLSMKNFFDEVFA